MAALEGVDDREAALALAGRGGRRCRARRCRHRPRRELYWSDLVGLSVVNREGLTLGRVGGVLDTGAHPVLQVEAEDQGGSERLIPLVPAYVDAIERRGANRGRLATPIFEIRPASADGK